MRMLPNFMKHSGIKIQLKLWIVKIKMGELKEKEKEEINRRKMCNYINLDYRIQIIYSIQIKAHNFMTLF